MLKKIKNEEAFVENNEIYGWCPDIRPGARLRVDIVDVYLEEYLINTAPTIEEEEEDTPIFVFIKNESSSR